MPNRKERRKHLNKGKHKPQYTKKQSRDKYPNGCFGNKNKVI